MANRVQKRSTRARSRESLRVRESIRIHLAGMIAARHLTQVQAANWLHTSQSRVSHLTQGRLHQFSTDTLLDMLAAAGLGVSVEFFDLESSDSRARTHRAPTVVLDSTERA